ncbi:MAG: RepA protein, partial [Hymenobacter sp.]
VTGYSQFVRFIEVEEDKFAKLYLSQLASFWDLSKPAIRVFSYILTVLKPKQDLFIFIMEDCLQYANYSSERSVFEGLTGLIEANIIARSNHHLKYYINPLVVFNGDRVTFAKTYVKKKKEKEENVKNQLNLFALE